MSFWAVIGCVFVILLSAFVGKRVSKYLIKTSFIRKLGTAPHHWTYGLALAAVGWSINHCVLGVSIFCVGAGLFISDIKDFLRLRILHTYKRNRRKRS